MEEEEREGVKESGGGGGGGVNGMDLKNCFLLHPHIHKQFIVK